VYYLVCHVSVRYKVFTFTESKVEKQDDTLEQMKLYGFKVLNNLSLDVPKLNLLVTSENETYPIRNTRPSSGVIILQL
jgi:hypothetical protein